MAEPVEIISTGDRDFRDNITVVESDVQGPRIAKARRAEVQYPVDYSHVEPESSQSFVGFELRPGKNTKTNRLTWRKIKESEMPSRSDAEWMNTAKRHRNNEGGDPAQALRDMGEFQRAAVWKLLYRQRSFESNTGMIWHFESIVRDVIRRAFSKDESVKISVILRRQPTNLPPGIYAVTGDPMMSQYGSMGMHASQPNAANVNLHYGYGGFRPPINNNAPVIELLKQQLSSAERNWQDAVRTAADNERHLRDEIRDKNEQISNEQDQIKSMHQKEEAMLREQQHREMTREREQNLERIRLAQEHQNKHEQLSQRHENHILQLRTNPVVQPNFAAPMYSQQPMYPNNMYPNSNYPGSTYQQSTYGNNHPHSNFDSSWPPNIYPPYSTHHRQNSHSISPGRRSPRSSTHHSHAAAYASSPNTSPSPGPTPHSPRHSQTDIPIPPTSNHPRRAKQYHHTGPREPIYHVPGARRRYAEPEDFRYEPRVVYADRRSPPIVRYARGRGGMEGLDGGRREYFRDGRGMYVEDDYEDEFDGVEVVGEGRRGRRVYYGR